eukprot:IDg20826t1
MDDLLRCSSDHFHELSRKTHVSFQMGENEFVPCEFSGFFLSRDSSGCLLQHQNSYFRNLEKPPSKTSYTEF